MHLRSAAGELAAEATRPARFGPPRPALVRLGAWLLAAPVAALPLPEAWVMQLQGPALQRLVLGFFADPPAEERRSTPFAMLNVTLEPRAGAGPLAGLPEVVHAAAEVEAVVGGPLVHALFHYPLAASAATIGVLWGLAAALYAAYLLLRALLAYAIGPDPTAPPPPSSRPMGGSEAELLHRSTAEEERGRGGGASEGSEPAPLDEAAGSGRRESWSTAATEEREEGRGHAGGSGSSSAQACGGASPSSPAGRQTPPPPASGLGFFLGARSQVRQRLVPPRDESALT